MCMLNAEGGGGGGNWKEKRTQGGFRYFNCNFSLEH